jgi:carbamoyl-phosphate synthase large subunit
MSAHRVLITGIGGNIGQGILKALRAAKRRYYIVGIDMEPLSSGFSLADTYYVMPRTGDRRFKQEVGRIIENEKIEAIYVSSPTELEFFSVNKAELERRFGIMVFVNPVEVVKIGLDKLMTANFLRKSKLSYLETARLSDNAALEEIIRKHGFPLIVKPRMGFTSKNVFLVNSRKEIYAARTLVKDLIVQRYIPDDAAEYTATTVSGPNKKVVALIVLHRDLIQGTTYRTELVLDSKITKQVTDIANALGTVGVCNFQFRLYDGKVFVFEINPRFSGTSGIRYLYGFNDPEMVFEIFSLGLKIGQPELHPAVVLRYWNEVFLPGVDFNGLRKEAGSHNGMQVYVDKLLLKKSQGSIAGSKARSKSLDEMANKYFTPKALRPDRKQMDFIMEEVFSNCKGPRVLELGYGSGHWTRRLVDLGFDVTVVEGSRVLADHCRSRFGKSVKVIHSLFEKFTPNERYDTIIASCVLEHTKDYRLFLKLLRSWLSEKGNLHIVVPNALSLHRRIGLKMGLLKDPMELSPQELEVGHHHSFTTDIFKKELERSGLKVNFLKGIFLKPLSSGQMMDWPEGLLEAYNKLSGDLPEYTAFLYANCSQKKG